MIGLQQHLDGRLVVTTRRGISVWEVGTGALAFWMRSETPCAAALLSDGSVACRTVEGQGLQIVT